MAAIDLVFLSILVLVVVSLLTSRPSQANLAVFVVDEESRAQTDAAASPTNIAATILLLVVVLGLWAWFSPLVFS